MKTKEITIVKITENVWVIGYDKYIKSSYYVKSPDCIAQYTKSEMMELFGLTYPDIEFIQDKLS